MSAKRLYLHVGLPKSGTTFLQGLMANNRTKLKDRGYIYPFIRRETMFHAAVELRGQHEHWGLDPERIDGTWQAVLRRIRSFDGAGIVSHELLAAAAPDQVQRVVQDTADLELHVVATARDLSKQATALWQEEVKNGRRSSFEEFSQTLFDDEGLGESLFWRTQHLAAVLEHWSKAVPPERLHVVVVPRSSQDPLELWRRFAVAIGLDAGSVDLRLQPRANESLGIAQVALLRQVLDALDGRLGQPHHAHVVKRFFAQTQLSRVSSPAPVTPPELRARLDGVAAGWVREIRERGYAVHGDLDELLPSTAPHPEGARHPDDVSAEEMFEGVPALIAEMLVEIASLRTQITGPKALPPLEPPSDQEPPAHRADLDALDAPGAVGVLTEAAAAEEPPAAEARVDEVPVDEAPVDKDPAEEALTADEPAREEPPARRRRLWRRRSRG